MQASSRVLALLIEPTLLALSKPSAARVAQTLEKARELRRSARAVIRESSRDLDAPSFDLGIATAFVEVLATAQQRSALGDALRGVMETPLGIETLHLIGFLARSELEATQGEIADVLKVDRGNFSRRVKGLEELGLVDSIRQGRKLTYALTALGYDVLAELRPGWRAFHPMSAERLASEASANAAAVNLLAPIQRAIAEEQSGALVDDLFTHVIRTGDGAAALLGVAKAQSKNPFGGPSYKKIQDVSIVVRAA